MKQPSPQDAFLAYHYQHINQRRLEHLSSLELSITGTTVLEVGAGIGDHTGFFLNRGCRIVSTDAREENLQVLHARYPDVHVMLLNLDDPDPVTFHEPFDIVYCYGVLYHLKNPLKALEFMSRFCLKMFLLETCVSFGDADLLHSCPEDATDPTQSVSGIGCRPTRTWVYNRLKQHFDVVYLPITQPDHHEFPLDWSAPPSTTTLTRAVFIASRESLSNSLLIDRIPKQQARH